MNGVHDMGGMDGFGPIFPATRAPDPDERLFHAPWEARALALTLAAGAAGGWSLDASRHARERIAPADYLAMSYYERWIAALEMQIAESRLLAAQGRAPLKAAEVPGRLARGAPTLREGPAPRFAIGQRVRARNLQPPGHTRLPAYLRGHAGEVVRLHGAHLLPDARAQGRDEPTPLYQVRFEACEVWGERAQTPGLLHADLFEPYLEAI
ncbi:MAG TPA: nitrile hydratase subunit beta [Caulobacteraceae bacterium]|jgi:nitrile hydratase|nr:nitrile hydratase subunit beta [Caulobacteraceae bacterium]